MAGTKIGLEIHISLNTVKSKLFCGCAISKDDAEPNTHTCPVCLGHPGAKPVLNEQVMKNALLLGLALGCTIHRKITFSRKSYFYPDMPNNYQITQFEIPLGENGKLYVKDKKIGITRIHIEEDPASLIHTTGMQASTFSLVDYNRAGVPLVEIVTEPDIESPEKARDFMKKLMSMLNYLGIFDNGTIKADANVSIEATGYTRAEIKNIGSFKEIEKALKYEIERQWHAFKNNEKVVMETRAWDGKKTFSLRTKESEADYGYIVEPNLPVFNITDSMIKEQEKRLPELPKEKTLRFKKDYGLKEDDAEVICSDKELASFFEKVVKKINPVFAATWIRRELVRQLDEKELEVIDVEIDKFVDLLSLFYDKKVTDNVFKKVLDKILSEDIDLYDYVRKNDLIAISDTLEIEKFCDEVISNNKQSVEDYRAGNEKALNFLIGQVMRLSKGKAAPDVVKEIILKKI